MVPILHRRILRGESVIEVQASAGPLGSADAAPDAWRDGRRERDDVSEPLVMAAAVVLMMLLSSVMKVMHSTPTVQAWGTTLG